MKKHKLIIIIVIFINLYSCKKETYVFDENLLIGNWSKTDTNDYQEYYFDKENMYAYSLKSGSTLHYIFKMKEDSLYLSLVYQEVKEDFKFYDKIIKIDSIKMKLENRIFLKVTKNNTLRMFINKEISSNDYFKACVQRSDVLSK
ncbi:hypothetical protein P700755_003134 [Psychroflexus torquis ATCC 700755]|uniref:Uncharacterized protein n=1 Tax=Psychroflexus torquis (strain ATCC 700755 / CIP 106069 / ACAM 623) TaxID=313595 RepID=K4IHF5_PSYTT|nr:hypothetical protein [Psychroflexus torquis]AFU69799.1 hypothetical protein P700755_003134 [Psychroflexus torquis ATCC 700755]